MKGVLRRGVSALCALFLVLGTAACQQKEPKMKDGKMLPNYLLLDAFGLLNTYWALLLPLAFAPLGTFLLTQIFRSVPADILQAARLDGAGTLQVMVKVLLPCGKSGCVHPHYFDTDRKLEHGGAAFDLLERRGKLSLVRVPGQPLHGEPAPAICLLRAVLAAAGAVLFLLRRRCVGQWDSQGGEGMKPVILKVSFALLLVLALCTVASYHIERIMMAKVTVSLPQDGIVRGVPCEATVLPLSSLTMQDGNTGVYIIDYVEGAFGEEMVVRFVPVTVQEQDQQNFSSGDLLDFREYVVSSNRPLKDGEEVATP